LRVTTLYLADVGFRTAGVRLATPMRVALGERRLTLDELIATPNGTELMYHVSGLTGDEGYTSKQDVVTIRAGSTVEVLAPGSFSFGTDANGLRRRLSSSSVIPLRVGPIELAITIHGIGEFQLAAAVRQFGADTDVARQDVNTSVTHDGITVTVRGVGAAREETAVEVEVAVGDGECCRGIGGYAGHRLGPTALTLRDESGRVYAERWQEPGRRDHVTLALFQPLGPSARELELTVPYIFLEEFTKTEALALPVTSPVEARLGRYPIRVVATTRVEAEFRPPIERFREHALRVDLDLGGWHGDRRLLFAGRILVDGEFCGVRYHQPGMNATQPAPVDRLELAGELPLTAKTLAFAHPCIQVRGPWRIGFSLDK
jgi:hypothetical protein